MKYGPVGSPIEVRLGVGDGEASFEVLDRGIGFDEEAEARVFETFYRSDSARRAADGLGIGLALAKLIIDALGGRIWASVARRRRGHRRVRVADRRGERLARLTGRQGQAGGRRASVGSASQSERTGAKTSTTTAPAGPTDAWCGVSDGIRHVPPGPELADLVADRERDRARDDHSHLLVLVTVAGHDGVRGELHEGQRDPLAVDLSRPNGVAPHVDDRLGSDVDQVAHRASFSLPVR